MNSFTTSLASSFTRVLRRLWYGMRIDVIEESDARTAECHEHIDEYISTLRNIAIASRKRRQRRKTLPPKEIQAG